MSYRIVACFLLCFSAVSARSATLNVLTCEPEWAALVTALGGDRVDVDAATTLNQDPHLIQARPSLIAKARRADLLICSGADLEIGWLPLLLRKSNNRTIQPGMPGHFMATDYVSLLERGSNVDRSEGDVHVAGNPHIHFDPRRMLTVADTLTKRLAQLDPEHAEAYATNLNHFRQQLNDTLANRADEINALHGLAVIVHHNSWVYLHDWLGIKQIGELEPKPGLPPTAAHLASLLGTLRATPANLIVVSSYQDGKAAHWLSERSGIPVLVLPYSVDDWSRPGALVAFYGSMIESLYSTINHSNSRT